MEGEIQAIKLPIPNPATMYAVIDAIKAPIIFPMCLESQFLLVSEKFLKNIKSLIVIYNPNPPKKVNKMLFSTALNWQYNPIAIIITEKNSILPEINLSIKSAFNLVLKVKALFPEITRYMVNKPIKNKNTFW